MDCVEGLKKKKMKAIEARKDVFYFILKNIERRVVYKRATSLIKALREEKLKKKMEEKFL